MGNTALERRANQSTYDFDELRNYQYGGLMGTPAKAMEVRTMDLDSARAALGVDLITVYEVNWDKETVRPINLSRSEGVTPYETHQISAVVEAFSRFRYADWTGVIDRTIYLKSADRYVVDASERRAIFNQKDPLLELATQLCGEPPPYAGVAGWRSDPREGCEGIKYVYAAVWVQGGFEAMFPLTQAAEQVDKALALETLTPPRIPTALAELVVRDEIEALSDENEIRIPLRRRLVRTYVKETGLLYIEGLSPRFIGCGAEFDSAWKDLVHQVGECVQALYRTRPFNRTEQMERVWRLLCRFINIQAYRDSRPMRLFRVGNITAAPSAEERVVVWEEDSREDRVRLDQAPREFFVPGEYPVSQRFEAMVYYDRTSNQLQSIREVKRLDPAITPEEAWEFWESIPWPGTESPPSDHDGRKPSPNEP
jgi:hypothetical protein